MVLNTVNVVAIRCPECGRMDFHALSMFDFSGKKTRKIECSCGVGLMTIGTKDWKRFWIQVHCIMCETMHMLYFARRELWSKRVIELNCDDTEVEIGYIGPREGVKAAIAKQDKSLQEMAEDLGFVEYFENPEIMYEVLDSLHRFAEGNLLSCQCGNTQINVEIFPERVELRCDNCEAQAVFYAESYTDIQEINRLNEIELLQGVTPYQDTRGKKRRRSKK